MTTPELWARIEPLLDRALDVAPPERATFLREACAGDAALLREVTRLLRSSERAETSILERSAAELAGSLLDAPERVVLDRYELLKILGSGGMGTVYLARDRALGRTVALKFLPHHVAADADAILRFRNEARAASALDHPNIAVVHDTATAEDGRPFIVMGFYEGETLSDRLSRGPLAVPEAVAIMTQVARGLAAAHAAGIVHRDIKPSNILVSPEQSVRILDFGIAKVANQMVTRPADTLGTAAYMSPEQTMHDVVDGRTDLWSLGVVLYEALAGRRPFTAKGDTAMVHAIRTDQPPAIRKLRPDVSDAVAAIVHRCLRRNPGRRFPDAGSLIRALEAAKLDLEGRGGSAAERIPLLYRLPRRALLVGGAIVTIALGSLSYMILRDRLATPGQRAIAQRDAPVRIAVLPFDVLGDARLDYLKDGMVELLSTQLDGAGPLRSVDPRALLAFLRVEAASGDAPGALLGARSGRANTSTATLDGGAVARRFDAALFLAGSVVAAGGQLRIRAALYDANGQLQAEAASKLGFEGQLFELVDDVARQLIGSRYAGRTERLTRLAAATTSSLPALKAYLVGERALREGHYDQALTSFQQAVHHDSTFALAWYRLAVAGEWTIRPAIAEQGAERSIRLAAALPEHDRLLVTGWHAYATGDATRAERIYRQILDNYTDDVEAWLQLGEVLFHYGPLEGRPLGGRAHFLRALSLEPSNEGALLHLARIAAREGKHSELTRLVDSLVAAYPGSEIAIEARALRAFATGDEVAVREVIDRYGNLDSDAVFTAIWTVGYTREPRAVARLARLLTDEGRPTDVRAAGHMLVAATELARGRPRSAKLELRAAAALNSAWALELGSIWALSGIVPGDDVWGVDSLRASLHAWDPTAVPASLAPSAYLEAHDGAHSLLKTYLLGLLDASRGQSDAAIRAAAQLDRASDSNGGSTLAANLARGLRAEGFSRAGRQQEALAVLEEAHVSSPYALAIASPFHARVRERFLRARLLVMAGRREEALRVCASFGDGSIYDLPYMVPAHMLAASLLEDMGRPQEAAEHYRRVAALWRDAEPELRGIVERARGHAGARTGGN